MENAELRVTVKRKLMKFNEGEEEPYEVTEAEDVLVGDEAVALLNQLGLKEDGTNAIN